jgi:Family of unknown function (DUF6152)
MGSANMKTAMWILAASFAVILAATPLLAHHSFAAEFDASKPITVTGKVTKVEWSNPHARIYVEAKNDKGETVNWDFEMGSPNNLMRQGWRRDSLNVGDEITVQGTLAKNHPNLGNARSVVMVKTGKRLFAASSEGDSTTP